VPFGFAELRSRCHLCLQSGDETPHIYWQGPEPRTALAGASPWGSVTGR
jgi:hypothetical protein